MGNRVAAVIFRLLFAVLALMAVAVQFFGVTVPKGQSVVNFFSYFTNLSNILIGVVLLVSAARLISGRAPTTGDTAVRGASVVYIVFVGIVFNTLLRDAELGDLIPWVNVILHFVIPIAGLLDWLIWTPRNRLPFRVTFIWMVFPVVYVAYSLTRGTLTGFYPYPFFNPGAVGGYGGVALYCLALVVGFFVLAVIIRFLCNIRNPARLSP